MVITLTPQQVKFLLDLVAENAQALVEEVAKPADEPHIEAALRLCSSTLNALKGYTVVAVTAEGNSPGDDIWYEPYVSRTV